MDIFSLFWQFLFLFISFLNMFIIFRYYIDRYLARSNEKIPFSLITGIAANVVFLHLLAGSYFLKGNNFSELFPKSEITSSVSIFCVFLISSIILYVISFSINQDYENLYKNIKGLTVGMLAFLLLSYTFDVRELSRQNVLWKLFYMPTDLNIFYIYKIYRNIILPLAYYFFYLRFIFISHISKKKYSTTGVYNKKIFELKTIFTFFYFVYFSGMVWFNLINYNIHYEDVIVFLFKMGINTLCFILIYITISCSSSNINNKAKIFGKIIKRTFILCILIPYILFALFLCRNLLQEININIITIIITTVIIATITCIINILINRLFKSKK